jgi:hypothetical protein
MEDMYALNGLGGTFASRHYRCTGAPVPITGCLIAA